MSGVLAFVELKNGALRSASAEVVSAARSVADELGGEVCAIVCGGSGAGESAAAVGEWGADKILSLESPELVGYHGELYASAVAEVISGGGYAVLLLAATAQGRDLAPRIAAKASSPLMTDATALEVSDGHLVVTRPVYAGKALARVRVEGTVQIASLRPNAIAKSPSPRSPKVELVTPAPSARSARYRVKGFEASPGAALDVSEASVIVSGGRGMKGPENWGLLEEVRDALGDSVALGASRAVVDAGWRPHGEQVGQTGKTVAPKLYFAMGISGAIQHLAGMRTSQVIVAVNKDPDAPIFGVADYGIVGDVFEVLPELAEHIRQLREA